MSTNLKNALCPLCGHRQLHEEVSDYKADFRSESGEPRSINVTAVKMLRCDACGETILGEESENRISEAQRAALGLLTAFELEQFRKALELSQQEMADLLGAGSKSYCRWESPDHFQSEAFDRFIRLLMFAPSNIEALKHIRREKRAANQSDETLARRFPYVKNVSSAQTSAKQFSESLMSGAFNPE